jgi:hypothetical protein
MLRPGRLDARDVEAVGVVGSSGCDVDAVFFFFPFEVVVVFATSGANEQDLRSWKHLAHFC